MSCYWPLPAYRPREGGAPSVGYNPGGAYDKLELPCGGCVGCRQDRARSWSIRCMHEAAMHDRNSFLTLTYDDAHVGRDLRYRDFQLFLKRMRKLTPLRFFVAGEYGPQTLRPHWHAIMFGYFPRDAEQLANGMFCSGEVERLWGAGNVRIGKVEPASACYVAGYTLDKSAANPYYGNRTPPFCQMSRRPGIGHRWYERFAGDLFPHDFAVSMDGKRYKVPRYYWMKFRDDADAALVEELEHARINRARAVDPAESSERRRSDREEVAKARSRLFARREVA